MTHVMRMTPYNRGLHASEQVGSILDWSLQGEDEQYPSLMERGSPTKWPDLGGSSSSRLMEDASVGRQVPVVNLSKYHLVW